MIVIGGRHSSNTCKLRDVCKSNADTFLIETAQELKNIDLSKYSYVGVTAGASTPSVIIRYRIGERCGREQQLRSHRLKEIWGYDQSYIETIGSKPIG